MVAQSIPLDARRPRAFDARISLFFLLSCRVFGRDNALSTVCLDRLLASAETFWYDQTEHEWVIVLSGRAKLRYEVDGAVVELGPGDAAFIPAHTKHQVAWTTPDEPTVWLALFWTDL